MLRHRVGLAGLVATIALLGGCFFPGGGGSGGPALSLSATQNGYALCGIMSGVCSVKFDVTVTNTGDQPTTVAPVITGTAPTNFNIATNGCSGAVLAAHSSCPVSVSVASPDNPVTGTITATAGSVSATLNLTQT